MVTADAGKMCPRSVPPVLAKPTAGCQTVSAMDILGPWCISGSWWRQWKRGTRLGPASKGLRKKWCVGVRCESVRAHRFPTPEGRVRLACGCVSFMFCLLLCCVVRDVANLGWWVVGDRTV